MRGLLIKTDRSTEVVEVGGYQDLNGFVGGYIEMVPLDTNAFVLYCNEEGKLRDLPFNSAATLLADLNRSWTDPLMGDVVVLGPTDGEGNETDLPQELIDSFMGLASVAPVFPA